MHETSAPHAAHQHAAPTSFIRKHVFSLDHKVIGKQYYGLALLAVFIGMVPFLAHAHAPGAGRHGRFRCWTSYQPLARRRA